MTESQTTSTVLHDRRTETETEMETATATETRTMRRLFGLAAIVAFVGWLDTALLTGIHLAVLPLPAGVDVGGTGWAVLVSDWSYLFGVPTAMYGSAYYLTVIVLALAWLSFRLPQIERLLLPVTTVGILMSGVFVYLQLFVIEAICPFCMISAGTTTILFLLGIAVFRTSATGSLSELGTTGLDGRTLLWPVATLAAGLAFLAMLHLVTVLPLPIPGS